MNNNNATVLIRYSEMTTAMECGDTYDELIVSTEDDEVYYIEHLRHEPGEPDLNVRSSVSKERIKEIFDYIEEKDLKSFENNNVIPPDGKDIRLCFMKDDGEHCCLSLVNMPDGTIIYLITIRNMLRAAA